MEIARSDETGEKNRARRCWRSERVEIQRIPTNKSTYESSDRKIPCDPFVTTLGARSRSARGRDKTKQTAVKYLISLDLLSTRQTERPLWDITNEIDRIGREYD